MGKTQQRRASFAVPTRQTDDAGDLLSRRRSSVKKLSWAHMVGEVGDRNCFVSIGSVGSSPTVAVLCVCASLAWKSLRYHGVHLALVMSECQDNEVGERPKTRARRREKRKVDFAVQSVLILAWSLAGLA